MLMGALAGIVMASSSFAGFSVTATRVASGSFDRYDIVAINAGGDTGTQIKGLEFFYSGSPAFFQVDDTSDPVGGDPDGIPDTVNLLSTTATRIRVSTTGANNVFVGVSPTNAFAQPNPYTNGVTSFSGALANTGTTQASGAGFQIARIFLATGGSGVFSGNLGGDIGSKVPFSIPLGYICHCGGPVIAPVPPVNVVFGSVVTNGAPFSANVVVTDTHPADILSLALGTLPSTVSGVTVTGATGTSPRVFTVSGTVSYAANGTDVVIPLIASNGFDVAIGSITLHVTPEPGTLGVVGLLLYGARCRRGND